MQKNFKILKALFGVQLLQEIKSMMNNELWAYQNLPNVMLMNGKGSYLDPNATQHESFTVTNGIIRRDSI